MFFDISSGEIFVILLVIFLLFGPQKIPELARKLGKGINELRRATDDIRNEINREANGIKKSMDPDPDDDMQKKGGKKPENGSDDLFSG